MGEEIGTRLTVIDPQGLVLADSDEDPSRMDNHGSRPEILAVRSHGSGIATRYSRTLGVTMMFLALPIEDKGHCWATPGPPCPFPTSTGGWPVSEPLWRWGRLWRFWLPWPWGWPWHGTLPGR